MSISNIDQAFASLTNSFTDMQEYDLKISRGELKDYDRLLRETSLDDDKFQCENPSHPLALANRSKRIGAVDKIRNSVLDGAVVLTAQQIDILHKSAFDCCAAVRESIVVILAYLRLQESLKVFQRLSALEPPKNKIMHNYIDDAISVIEQKKR